MISNETPKRIAQSYSSTGVRKRCGEKGGGGGVRVGAIKPTEGVNNIRISTASSVMFVALTKRTPLHISGDMCIIIGRYGVMNIPIINCNYRNG